MPFTRALAYGVYTLWVSVCAFAPEFLWQGLVLMRGHFGAAELISALFIGTLFAFFVEPLVERLKAGRWNLAHAPSGGMLLGVLVSLVFGVVVVCIHEAMIAYLGAEHAGDEAKRASLARAIDSACEWASIPAAITAAWFVVGTSRRLALPATGFACVWIVIIGHSYGWGWPIVMTSVVPGFLIALLGSRIVLRHWDASTIPALAQLTAWVAGSWMLLAWGIQAGSAMIDSPGLQLYTPEAFVYAGGVLRGPSLLSWLVPGAFGRPQPAAGPCVAVRPRNLNRSAPRGPARTLGYPYRAQADPIAPAPVGWLGPDRERRRWLRGMVRLQRGWALDSLNVAPQAPIEPKPGCSVCTRYAQGIFKKNGKVKILTGFV